MVDRYAKMGSQIYKVVPGTDFIWMATYLGEINYFLHSSTMEGTKYFFAKGTGDNIIFELDAFKKKGYLKEIPINSDQSYFDTNTSHHHHFYDENQNDLIDIDDADVEPVKINTRIPGKKIKSVEVLVKVEDAE